jgi:hypothetical protein
MMTQESRRYTSRAKPSIAGSILAGVLSIGAAQMAVAADITISSQTATFDCSSVNPGDTVTLASGLRGPLTLRTCDGTGTKPIIIRNDPDATGPTTIRRTAGSAGGYVFTCVDCVGVVIDGSYKWVGAPGGITYGIKITITGGGAPAAFLRLTGLTSFVTVRGVEIDGAWPSLADNGIGISLNDHSKTAAANPGAWYEGFIIEKSYVHNVQGEGMYIGPNWYVGGIPLRNIEIRNNLVEDTGWDGIQMKSAISGTNLIHHNVLRRVGAATSGKIAGEIFGISMLDGPGKIFNNYVERSGDTAIQHWLPDLPASYGPQEVEIYNNVVVDAGVTGATGSQGISSGHANTNRDGEKVAETLPKIYNNTIVRPRGWGITVGSVSTAQAFVRDNIIADAASGPIKAPASVSKINNRIGAVSQMDFIDAPRFDFRLKETSPARNAGGDTFPYVDFDDVARPVDGRADQGAFEYHIGDGEARPAAPVFLSVQ